MPDVRLTWDLPPVSNRQAAIRDVEISFRAAGIPDWTIQDNIAPDVAQEIVFVDVAPGDYEYQAVVYDIIDVAGAPVTASASVPFDPPGEVANFTVILE